MESNVPCLTAEDSEEAGSELELTAGFASEDSTEDETASDDEAGAEDSEDAGSELELTAGFASEDSTEEETASDDEIGAEDDETATSDEDAGTLDEDDSKNVVEEFIPEDIALPSNEDKLSTADDELSPQPANKKQAITALLKPIFNNFIQEPLSCHKNI